MLHTKTLLINMGFRMPRETVKLDLDIEGETQMAVLVKNLNDEKVWLPKSQIEIHGSKIEMPTWLAENKELI